MNTLETRCKGSLKYVAGSPETYYDDSLYTLQKPRKSLMMGFEKKNCENLLKEVKNYIF